MLTSQPRTPIATSSVASSPSNTVIPIGAPGDQRAQQMVETGIVGSLTGAVETPLKEVEEVGKGLRNEIGQYNCFLNVVIQVAFSISNLKSTMEALGYCICTDSINFFLDFVLFSFQSKKLNELVVWSL